MQLSIKHKFAFLCIPKCGSTTVERAIRAHCKTSLGGHPSLKHINAHRFQKLIRPLLRVADPRGEIETFCIMREPLDRLKSWFAYRSRLGIRNPSRSTGAMDFAEFVEAHMDPERSHAIAIGSQSKFIRLHNGRIGVDHIFRLDQMDTVAGYLSDKLGQPVDLKVANRSADKAARKSDEFDLPDDLRIRLMEHLADDYRIFNKLPWSAATGGDPFLSGIS